MEKVFVCTLVYLNMNYSPTATNDIVSTMATFFGPGRQFIQSLLFSLLYNGHLSTMVVVTRTRPKCQDHPSPTASYPLTDEGCMQNPIFNVNGHQT